MAIHGSILLSLFVVAFLLSLSLDGRTRVAATTGGELFADGDCLSHEALDVFRTTPGGYEVTEGHSMNGTLCSSLCADFDFPFAGVIYRQYCLCATDQDFASLDAGRQVARIESHECDVNPNVRFYGSSSSRSRTGDSTGGGLSAQAVQVKIACGVESALVDETLVFDITSPSNSKLDGLEFQVDFDDGSPLTPWSDKRRLEHTFRIPSRFLVKMHVRSAKQPDTLITGASTVVSIGQKMDETEVDFACRQLIEPGDSPGCNVTLYAGQDVGVYVDFGDESEPFVFNTSGESLCA